MKVLDSTIAFHGRVFHIRVDTVRETYVKYERMIELV